MWTKNSQPMGKMSENFRGIFLTHTVVDGQQCCRESVGQTFALVLLSCRQVAYLEIWKERPRSAFHVYIFKSIQILALFVFILKISTKMGGQAQWPPKYAPWCRRSLRLQSKLRRAGNRLACCLSCRTRSNNLLFASSTSCHVDGWSSGQCMVSLTERTLHWTNDSTCGFADVVKPGQASCTVAWLL